MKVNDLPKNVLFISNDHEVAHILHSLGRMVDPDSDSLWYTRKAWIDYPYGALFVEPINDSNGDLVDYGRVWGIVGTIPYDDREVTEIHPKKTRVWRAYCVCEGMLGYLPNNVTYFTNKKESRAYAKELRASDIVVNTFPTKAARDQFISENSEF